MSTLQLSLRRIIGTASPIVRRSFSTEAAAAASNKMTLNFNLPHENIYSNAQIDQVIVPGSAGEYGITAKHVPIVAELKAGVLKILHGEGKEEEKYFVPGGFSITHPDSVTVSLSYAFNIQYSLCIQKLLKPMMHSFQDITCPEAVKLDDIDQAAVTKNYEAAKSAFASAESGSVAQAEAKIEMDVNRAMASAIGVTLA